MSFRVIGIGELLWDLFPVGPKLGGAPANVVYHAHALGADARLISRVGRDEWGRRAIEALDKLGIPTNGIEQDDSLPTGTVTVAVDRDGQPSFIIHQNVAWDAIAGAPAGRLAVETADALCFGTLAQRSEPSRSTVQSLLAASPSTALRILDLNLRQHYSSPRLIEESLALANVLKVNEAELQRLAEWLALDGGLPSQIEQLTHRYDLRLVACTRGERGSVLFRDRRWSEHPGVQTQVEDTVGAGDSFTAAMVMGLLLGWDLDQVNHHANAVAAYVASCTGATPALPDGLRRPFLAQPLGQEQRRPQA
jgi:fructokinase